MMKLCSMAFERVSLAVLLFLSEVVRRQSTTASSNQAGLAHRVASDLPSS